MSSDFEVDVQALQDFAKATRDNVIGNGLSPSTSALIKSNLSDMLGLVVPQKLSLGEAYGTDFQAAFDLKSRYRQKYDDWHTSYQKFLNALETLAAVADELAKSYQDAQDYDQVSAKSVDDTFNDVPPTQVPLSGSSATTPTS